MRKYFLFFLSVAAVLSLNGCGYTTTSQMMQRYSTIHVDTFKNKITFSGDADKRNLYFPLLEVDTHNAIVDRFLFEGKLRPVDAQSADLTLRGVLKNYHRSPLRYTDNNDVEEYRVYITVGLELWDNRTGTMLWKEDDFVGDATYFISGSQASSEQDAVNNAVDDLARRIVERVIEDW